MALEARPPRDRPVLYVDDLDDPILDDGDYHHAARVLRLRDGEVVTVSDGNGRWRPAALAPRPDPVGDSQAEPVDRQTTIGLALIKALPDAVRKVTEVGVTEIILLDAERNVVQRSESQIEGKLDRLRAIVREAGTQSRRARLPVVTGPIPVAAAARRPGFFLAEPGAPPLSDAKGVLIGPEGGWTPEERAAGRVAGLGNHVLRAETAAVVAGAFLVAR